MSDIVSVIQTSWSGDSCTHTDTQNNPWWKVNFGRQVKVTGLRVYGRSDCCADRLQGFEVWVGNHNYEPDANAACALDQAARKTCPEPQLTSLRILAPQTSQGMCLVFGMPAQLSFMVYSI